MQAAREGRQDESGAQTPFASPGKRLKTPTASPAARVLASGPDSPEQAPARTRAAPCHGGRSYGRDDVEAALAAVSAYVEGNCAETELASSKADASSGKRAGVHRNASKGAGVRHAVAARAAQTAPLAQSSQGVSTPAKQPQARQRYTDTKSSARDALAAAHKAAAKRIAQVLLKRMGLVAAERNLNTALAISSSVSTQGSLPTYAGI